MHIPCFTMTRFKTDKSGLTIHPLTDLRLRSPLRRPNPLKQVVPAHYRIQIIFLIQIYTSNTKYYANPCYVQEDILYGDVNLLTIYWEKLFITILKYITLDQHTYTDMYDCMLVYLEPPSLTKSQIIMWISLLYSSRKHL